MRARLCLAALVVPVLALVATPVAHADDDPVSCTIVDTSPDIVSIGLTPKRVQFDVGTDCDDDYDVDWVMSSEIYPGSPGVSWLGVCNYARESDHATFDCQHHGSAVINMVDGGGMVGNVHAGQHLLNAFAFVDVNDNNRNDFDEPLANLKSSFRVLRATTFGSSFDASPEPRKRGQSMTLTGSIQRANWDTDAYEKFGAWVSLQFRPDGEDDYQDVKYVWDDGIKAKTTIKVTASGSWRYHYGGNDVSGPSNSKADYVSVRGGGHSSEDAVSVRPKPKTFVNCDAMHVVYPHGVGKLGARDTVRGHTKPVTNFVVYTAMYNKNTKSDRDKDGVACEKL